MAVVHDAARPLASPDLVRRCVDALEGVDCAFAAARVTDTVHEGDELVERSLDRSRLWAAQTPQVVRADVLRRALERDGTDEASLVLAAGGTVRPVETGAPNLKITTPLTTCGGGGRCLLTDLHVHLRPDDDGTPPEEYFTAAQRRALPRGRDRARDRRAGRLRARAPLHRRARRLGPPLLARAGHRRPRRLLRLRARRDRPAAGDRGRLRGRARGPHGRLCSTRASGTTWSARCTS